MIGRGVPPAWLDGGPPITVTNFPTTAGRRAGVRITSTGRSVSLTLSGAAPTAPVLFQLPSFVGNIATTSAGTVDQATGTVTLAPARPPRHSHPAPRTLIRIPATLRRDKSGGI